MTPASCVEIDCRLRQTRARAIGQSVCPGEDVLNVSCGPSSRHCLPNIQLGSSVVSRSGHSLRVQKKSLIVYIKTNALTFEADRSPIPAADREADHREGASGPKARKPEAISWPGR